MLVASCPRCKGRGTKYDEPCQRCGGQGEIVYDRARGDGPHVRMAVVMAEQTLALEGLRAGLAVILVKHDIPVAARERLLRLYERARIDAPQADISALVRKVEVIRDVPEGCPLTAVQLRMVRQLRTSRTIRAAAKVLGCESKNASATLGRARAAAGVRSNQALVALAVSEGWF
jgi:hypothetical protein